MSFEEDIDVQSDMLVIPLPPKRWCSSPGCRTPLAQSNRENMCYRHLQEQHRKKIMGLGGSNQSNELGAGLFRAMKPRKRGRPAQIVAAPSLPATRSTEEDVVCVSSLPEPIPITEMEIEPMPETTPEAAAEVEAPKTEINESPKEEVTSMTIQVEEAERPICAVMGCDKVVSKHNQTGRCSGHYYLKRGTQMKDGSIPRPHSKLSKQMVEARKENVAKGTTGLKRHKTLPAPTVLITKDELESGMVSLKVPAAALDRFFMNLSLEDKTRIIERELLGA